jgi:hypothetical protein
MQTSPALARARFFAYFLLFAACALLRPAPAAAQQFGGGPWFILSADYGVGENRVDVTRAVRGWVHDGVPRVSVDPEHLGVPDPAYGVVKTLRIRARNDHGGFYIFRFEDRVWVDLHIFRVAPEEHAYFDQGWSIVNADYGIEGRRVDVTRAIRGWVESGAQVQTVLPQNMGIQDPAYGHRKALRIRVHDDDGVVREFDFYDNDTVDMRMFEDERPDHRRRRPHELELIAAEYGVEGNRVNVTAPVEEWIESGRPEFRVLPENFGIGDPAPHEVKILRIRVRDSQGHEREFTYRDKEVVEIGLFH